MPESVNEQIKRKYVKTRLDPTPVSQSQPKRNINKTKTSQEVRKFRNVNILHILHCVGMSKRLLTEDFIRAQNILI